MSPYDIQRAGPAVDQYLELRSRAEKVGRIREFDYWFDDILLTLRDPSRATQVGRFLTATQKPGGQFRDWIHGIFYVRYAVFPDDECGWIDRLRFEPRDWIA